MCCKAVNQLTALGTGVHVGLAEGCTIAKQSPMLMLITSSMCSTREVLLWDEHAARNLTPVGSCQNT